MQEFFQFHSSSTTPDFLPESLFRSTSAETLLSRWDELLLNFNDFEEMVWEDMAEALDQSKNSINGVKEEDVISVEVVRESLRNIKIRCDEGCSPVLALKWRRCLRKRSRKNKNLLI
ncbi:hypothetical protein CXB51_034763 [Gossypium anomalum]|uniref:Uncharacterized protein n=1 Tax=Gossypium anomalum TaxID=47600 RepID=A0A8J6CM55_9ROSI|nr:hypothetical protein CXB51_034763 [Gossypium anomalum]